MKNDSRSKSIEVLLAVRNGENYLEEFLDSLLRQSYDDFHLLVSDNKSTDQTASILADYAPLFKGGMTILPLPAETLPVTCNFARVSDAASADYVMYADADDIWHADKVACSLFAMREAEAQHGRETPLLVHSDLAVVDSELAPIHPSFWAYQNIDPSRTRLRQLLLRNCVTGCTCMANKSLMQLAVPIPDAAMMHDYWLALVAAAQGQILSVPAALIEYRQHSANDTGAQRWSPRFVLGRARNFTADKGARRSFRRKLAQAAALRARLTPFLSEDDRILLDRFCALAQQSFGQKRLSVMRYGFWDDGLLRNLAQLAAL